MQINKVIIGHIVGLVLLVLSTSIHGQTCSSSITPTTPDSRYQDNGNGTVSDLHTGLMWQRCSVGQSASNCTDSAIPYTWDWALQYPQTLNSLGGFAGFSDWRLPNSKELESLVEEACHSPAINLTHFPNTPSSDYLSSSPFVDDLYYAWVVFFSFGGTNGNYRYNPYYLRLVRSEQ